MGSLRVSWPCQLAYSTLRCHILEKVKHVRDTLPTPFMKINPMLKVIVTKGSGFRLAHLYQYSNLFQTLLTCESYLNSLVPCFFIWKMRIKEYLNSFITVPSLSLFLYIYIKIGIYMCQKREIYKLKTVTDT